MGGKKYMKLGVLKQLGKKILRNQVSIKSYLKKTKESQNQNTKNRFRQMVQ